MKRLSTVSAVLVGVVLTTGIALADNEAEQAIREAGNQALKAAQAKDVARWVSFYTDDATVYPPNEPVLKGKEAIQGWLSEAVANPNFAISWETTEVEVAEAGDLGFASGTYEATVSDEEGKPVSVQGKWVSVYKKQADGTWKWMTDIWNKDQPPA